MKVKLIILLISTHLTHITIAMDERPSPYGKKSSEKRGPKIKRATPMGAPTEFTGITRSPSAESVAGAAGAGPAHEASQSKLPEVLKKKLPLKFDGPEFEALEIFTPKFELVVTKEIQTIKQKLEILERTLTQIMQGNMGVYTKQADDHRAHERKIDHLIAEHYEVKSQIALLLSQQRIIRELLSRMVAPHLSSETLLSIGVPARVHPIQPRERRSRRASFS